MLIVLNEHSSIPNYQQIILQIKSAIIKGIIKKDDQLPSIRSLAKQLEIAIITVKRAYEELEKEGITYTISGKGVYVNDVDKEILKQTLLSTIKEQMQDVIRFAQYYNFTDEQLLKVFKEVLGNE